MCSRNCIIPLIPGTVIFLITSYILLMKFDDCPESNVRNSCEFVAMLCMISFCIIIGILMFYCVIMKGCIIDAKQPNSEEIFAISSNRQRLPSSVYHGEKRLKQDHVPSYNQIYHGESHPPTYEMAIENEKVQTTLLH